MLSVSVMSVGIVCALSIIVVRVTIIVIVHDLIFIVFSIFVKKEKKNEEKAKKSISLRMQ